MSLGLASVFSASDSESISSDEAQAIVDDSPCYALLEFPDCFYRVQSLKLVLGREPDDFNTYNQRLIVSDQKPLLSRKRKRSDISDDDDSLSTHSVLDSIAIKPESDYDNCITAIGGIGGPQASLTDDPDEVFIAIHPNVDEDGDVKDKAISKKHLRFMFSEEFGWHLEIIGRNGVYLNEMWHGKGEQVILEDKDLLTVVGLRFRWHTTSPEGEESDLESLSDFDEEGLFAVPILKQEAALEAQASANAMQIDNKEESEEDDGYEEDEEDEDRPLAHVIRKKKKKVKEKEKEREKVQEQEKTTKSLKLTLKIPKSKPEKAKSAKAPKLETIGKEEKIDKVDKVEKDKRNKAEKTNKPASKKPKIHDEKAKKGIEKAKTPIEVSNDSMDVVQSVEKAEEGHAETTVPTKATTPTASAALDDSETPTMTPGTAAQPGTVRDPVLHGEAPPPKRRGPGRPPADGVMSKRERRERQKAEQMGIPYGEPLPFKAEPKKEGEGSEKKKKVKRENTDADGDEDEDGADGETAETETPALPRAPSPKESDYPPEKLVKPEETYQVLLYQVLSETTTPLALPQVYEAIKNKWPYFRFKVGGTGWESSVRHNLQSSKYFKKAGKAGKGHLWAIDPDEPFEHKAKRADPPQPAPYQPARPYQYQQGYQGPNRPAGTQPYAYYGAPGVTANGQRPGMAPNGQPYPAFYPQNGTVGGEPRPAGSAPAGTLYNPARPGQPNGFNTASPAQGQPRPNTAYDQVCNGVIPEVFLKFQDQLEKLSQPSANGTNIAVEQAALAIKWIMAHPRSDEGIEKEGSQLQHMVKVLRSLLQSIVPAAQPPRPAVSSAPIVNRAQTGTPGTQNTFSAMPPRPLGQPGMMAPVGPTAQGAPASHSIASNFPRPGQPLQNTAFPTGPAGQPPRPFAGVSAPGVGGQIQFAVRPPGTAAQIPTSGNIVTPTPNTQPLATQPLATKPLQGQQQTTAFSASLTPAQGQSAPLAVHASQAGSVRPTTASLAQSPLPGPVKATVQDSSAAPHVPASTMTTPSNNAIATPAVAGMTIGTTLNPAPVAQPSGNTIASPSQPMPPTTIPVASTAVQLQNTTSQPAAAIPHTPNMLPPKVAPAPAATMLKPPQQATPQTPTSPLPPSSTSSLPPAAITPSPTPQVQPTQS